MFQLFEMKREVRIPPHLLGHDRVDTITDELNTLYANKVVLGLGLCVALWDLKEIGPGVIYQGDGGVHSQVTFRYIVFRPFQDEVIAGKIKRCGPDGIHVTIGFFDDIFIPQEGLPHPSKFDEREQSWVWEYKADEEEEEPHEMIMEKGDEIRFRVTGETFTDTTPVPSGPEEQEQDGGNKKVPYMLTGSINEAGLGLLAWWN